MADKCAYIFHVFKQQVPIHLVYTNQTAGTFILEKKMPPFDFK